MMNNFDRRISEISGELREMNFLFQCVFVTQQCSPLTEFCSYIYIFISILTSLSLGKGKAGYLV